MPQQIDRWIACANAMPPKDALYLVYALSCDETRPFITTVWYEPGVGWSGIARVWLDANAITYWMPLPDPPKEADSDRPDVTA